MFEISSLPDQAPAIDAVTRPYFQGFAQNLLLLPRCSTGHFFWIPRAFCPDHPEARVHPVPAVGTGSIYSFTVVHRGEGIFAESAPYVLAYVELTEGPRLMTNIVDCGTAQLAIGMRVEVVFSAGEAGWALPRFRPQRTVQSEGDTPWT